MSAETTEQFDQGQADRERFGFLVNPDLTYRRIVFDEDTVRETLGGVTDDVVDVAFDQEGNRFHAIFRPDAAQLGQEPNPVASLARNTAETDNPEFLTDRDGASVDERTIEKVLQAIRAVENYRTDNAEEFDLWRNAVLNR